MRRVYEGQNAETSIELTETKDMVVREKQRSNWTDLYVKEKINGQVYYLVFQQSGNPAGSMNFDELRYWIILSVYNKIKEAGENERKKRITGEDPFVLFGFCKQAVPLLLEAAKCKAKELNKPLRITVGWVDEKRRITYEKYLSKFGFQYSRTKKMLVLEVSPDELRKEEGISEKELD